MPGDRSAAAAAATVTAALLLHEPIPSSDRAALYRRARLLVDQLWEQGPWDAIRDLLFCARRDALAADAAPEQRQEALALLAALEDPSVAERLVRGARVLGSIPSELATILRAAGEETLWAIAALLRQEATSPIAASLRQVALHLGPEAWSGVVKRAMLRSFDELAPLLPLVARLDPPLNRDVARALVSHPDLRVRQRVLAYLFASAPFDPPTRELARRTLLGKNQEEADLTRAALLHHDPIDPELLELALREDLPTKPDARLLSQLQERAEGAPTSTAAALEAP